jgi:phage terminase small subunit
VTTALAPLTNPKHEVFAQEYARTRNMRRAAAVAGMGGTNTRALIARYPELGERITALVQQQFEDVDLTAQDVLRELKRVAMQRIDDLVDPVTGDALPLNQLPDDVAATVVAVDYETKWEGKGDAATPITVTKVRRADKMAALGLLAKHFKIVGDEGDGVNALAAALADRLKAGRRRAFTADAHDTSEVEDARIVSPRQVVDSTPVEVVPSAPAASAVTSNHEDLL